MIWSRVINRSTSLTLLILATGTAVAACSVFALPMLVRSVLAQTCSANCGSRQVQFTPGQAIRLQMVNRTASLVQVQQVPLTDLIPLLPGSEVEVNSNFGTAPNLSILFWDETSLAVRAVLFRPEPDVLRIELLPANAPGDRSIYVENDGKVRVF